MPNLYVQNVKPVNIHIGSQQIRYVRVGSTVVWEYTTTTTTTTTQAPITFDIASSCSVGSGVITISNFQNGSGQYQASSTYHTSIANAFSGTFVDASSPKVYTAVPNGTWYIVVRDKNNTSLGTYHSISVSCTTTTTTTPTGAGYYDCGYGCQYYTYNPGCTPCTPSTQTVYVYNYSSDIEIYDIYISSNLLNVSYPISTNSTRTGTASTGTHNITIDFVGTNTYQSIYISDSNSNITCWDFDGFSTSHEFTGIYISSSSTISIYAVQGNCN